MNLNELKFTKDLESSEHPEDLEYSLKKYGWHVLGTGSDAIVAEHPNKKYVLKIFANDSYYSNFVNFVKNNQNNPHLPKFSRWVRKIPGTYYNYVRMEKLQEIPFIKFENNSFLNELTYLYRRGQMYNICTLAGMLDDDVKKSNLRLDEIKDKVDNEWKTICNALVKYSYSINMKNLDLHESNFMLRDTNTLVIIDPFSETTIDGKYGERFA